MTKKIKYKVLIDGRPDIKIAALNRLENSGEHTHTVFDEVTGAAYAVFESESKFLEFMMKYG